MSLWQCVAATLLLALMGAGGRIWWLEHELADVRDNLVVARRDLGAVTAANTAQTQTIADLKFANDAWATAAQKSAAAAGEAALQAEAFRRQAAAAAAARPRDTAPDCLAMESLPMAICPMRAEQLRSLVP